MKFNWLALGILTGACVAWRLEQVRIDNAFMSLFETIVEDMNVRENKLSPVDRLLADIAKMRIDLAPGQEKLF